MSSSAPTSDLPKTTTLSKKTLVFRVAVVVLLLLIVRQVVIFSMPTPLPEYQGFLTQQWAVKDQSIYHYGHKIELANAQTLQPLGNQYGKDILHVFVDDEVIPGADPQTFQIIKNDDVAAGYSKDATHVFWQKNIVEGADPRTFVYFKKGFGQDKNSLYVQGRAVRFEENGELRQIDLPTFAFINETYFKDAQHVYSIGKEETFNVASVTTDPALATASGAQSSDRDDHIIVAHILADADPATFEVLDENYAKDKNSAYFKGYKVTTPYFTRFKDLGSSYAVDDKYLYYYYGTLHPNTQLEILGPTDESFKLLNMFFAKTNSKVFCQGKVVEGVAAPRFEPFLKDSAYGSDGKQIVYCDANYNRIVNMHDADASSFKVLSGLYAKDRQTVFLEGLSVPGVDAATFTVINQQYSKDKSHVYTYELASFRSGLRILPGVSPKNFVIPIQ